MKPDTALRRLQEALNQFSADEVTEWCRSRETSEPIGRAIFARHSSVRERARVWRTPSEEEVQQVMVLAWQLADAEDDELHWGSEPFKRPAAAANRRRNGRRR